MSAKPLSDEELAALWGRYHQGADEGQLTVGGEGEGDLTAGEFRRLLLEIEFRRAETAELEEELYRAFVAGFGVSQRNFNAEHPFYDLAIDIDSNAEIQQAFKTWRQTESF